MSPEAARRAAALLLAARRECRPIPELPEDCRPGGLDDAYVIQDAFVEARGGTLVGFKIGATSRRAQDFLSVEAPFRGCIFRDRVYDSPAAVSVEGANFYVVEPEFAVRLGADLPARDVPYTRAETAAAVAAVHPAFELINSAFGDAWTTVGGASLAADNGVHDGFVLGPATEDWRGLDLAAHPVRLVHNGAKAGIGTGANALGHPLDSLAWLADRWARGGRGLKAGDLVTTGVVTPFLYGQAGDEFVADFGTLGEVRLRVTP